MLFDGSCFFLSGFFGRTLVSAYAEEEYIKPVKRYYTSIQLQAGDSLWDIAEEYMDGSGYSKKEYVEVLKRMNGLEQRQNSCRSVFDCGLFCRIAEAERDAVACQARWRPSLF